MQVVSGIADVRSVIAGFRESRARVGFVPTMGALHQGHLSLVERSNREADVTVMSIFVNPLQFAPTEDLSRYPRPIEEDERLAREAGVSLLFRPEVADMYSEDRTITVAAGDLGSRWEGESRPGHFDGVLTVVAKLFNIVTPDVTVFGRKDLQQAALVSALIRDLDIPIELVVAPIVRERDGLALSSRNRYLSPDDRRRATILNEALQTLRVAHRGGQRETSALESAGRAIVAREPGVRLDYLAVVDPSTFLRRSTAEPHHAAIIAARVGTTRLIDNMTLGDDQD